LHIGGRRLRFGMGLAVVAATIAVASCGPAPNTTPVGTSLSSFSAPPVNGLGVTFNLTGAPPGMTGTASSATSAPTGVSAPSSVARTTQSIAGAVPFLYTSASVSRTISASVFVNEVLTLTNAFSPSASYYVEIDDAGATPSKLATIAGTVSGGVVTFVNANGNGSGGTILIANHVYVFQFYYIPGAPTPSPTPVPGALNATASLAINGPGSSNAGTVTVQETGYGGTFSENDTCAGIATVTTSSASGPSATFTVTGIAAGGCSATFSDSHGQQASTSIAVTTTGFGVNTHARGGAR
jgi:hypothetical protein